MHSSDGPPRNADCQSEPLPAALLYPIAVFGNMLHAKGGGNDRDRGEPEKMSDARRP